MKNHERTYNHLKELLLLLVFIATASFSSIAQTPIGSWEEIDLDLLNKYILEEVNDLRKKAKVQPLKNEPLLRPAADDHASYMRKKEKTTHFQRFNWKKKTPKNRVDFYGMQFDRVGENVQQNLVKPSRGKGLKKNPEQHTYESLAEELVLSWKNSPGHYKNMVYFDFENTYTSIKVNAKGEVYACQLLGGSSYYDKFEDERPDVKYKRDNSKRCWRCNIRPPSGTLSVSEDGEIYFDYIRRRLFQVHIFTSRMRFFNPWRDGLAADIIVKTQYPCDSSSFFNGQTNVRGFSLEPVYRKNFGLIRIFQKRIYLGKVPNYVTEDYEVNLVVIQNKRPCSNTMFYQIPAAYYVDIPLSHDIKKRYEQRRIITKDSISSQLTFEKSAIEPMDLIQLDSMLKNDSFKKGIHHIDLNAFASIEGTTENNTLLYTQRAQFLIDYLKAKNYDTTRVHVVMKENFADFRKDILGTKYAYLDILSNAELKQELLNPQLSDSLEDILKNHRSVLLKIETQDTTYVDYTKETLYPLLKQSIVENKRKETKYWQEIEFDLVEKGEISKADMFEIQIEQSKKNMNNLHARAIMRFHLDSANRDSLIQLWDDLENLRSLRDDPKLHSSIRIINFRLYEMRRLGWGRKQFYDTIRKDNKMSSLVKARILLNFAAAEDWRRSGSVFAGRTSKYYHKKVKRYVRQARLDVDKTFEIATYYAYFHQERYAFSLIKSKIDDTDNPDDIIFFLKLIYLLDVKLPKSTIIRYFKKVRNLDKEKFCDYFNNPALNFQILDDLDIKEIYCEACAGREGEEREY